MRHLTNGELAQLAGVGVNTVSWFVRLSSADAMKRVLEAKGAVFVDAGNVAPIHCVGVTAVD